MRKLTPNKRFNTKKLSKLLLVKFNLKNLKKSELMMRKKEKILFVQQDQIHQSLIECKKLKLIFKPKKKKMLELKPNLKTKVRTKKL